MLRDTKEFSIVFHMFMQFHVGPKKAIWKFFQTADRQGSVIMAMAMAQPSTHPQESPVNLARLPLWCSQGAETSVESVEQLTHCLVSDF